MDKQKVVVIGDLFPSARERLEEKCELVIWDQPERIPQELLYDRIQSAEGLFSRGDIKVDEELLSRAPHLRVVAQASVGYDNIDIDACTKRSIPFGNTPGVLVEATADLTFGLVLTSARRIHEGWHLFGEEQFKKMKYSAYFINASRGAVVDTNALCNALLHQEICLCGIRCNRS